MNNKDIYYSCVTLIAYEISQWFYNEIHYVWCTPYFDPPSRLNPYNSVPPSSNPRALYWSLMKDVEALDLHSSRINTVRAGIQRGAASRLHQGMIGASQYREILKLIRLAQPANFKPLMLVIPGAPVTAMLNAVTVAQRASLFSEEYIIESLPRNLFDAIEL
ncbi:hypothetical protein [Rugamonas rivuli]|uniref:Uncharacterized protein n=1 Tax=Rugamonas rivuli TaxID=2743358 RepID=A0A843SL68_9BURK|nr:hypothetical protein [Rugamonas rivuli]MQA21056.1 hypothetical protein [Rugamonas rivuli]